MSSNEQTLSFGKLYPSLSSLGLTSVLLLSVAEDSDDGSDFESLKVSSVTNENVVELHSFMNRNSLCTYYTFWKWISLLYGDSWPKVDFPTIKAIRQSAVRLSSRLTKLKKMPSSSEKSSVLSKFYLKITNCLEFLSHMVE